MNKSKNAAQDSQQPAEKMERDVDLHFLQLVWFDDQQAIVC